MTNTTLFSVALLSTVICAAGCAAPTSEAPGEGEETASEDELKASECPAKVEVLLLKPTIASDATMKRTWERDLWWESDPPATAAQQMIDLASHVTKARSQTAVKLVGTRGRACSYATVDAATGQKNGYRFWFAKSGGPNGQLQLRIERDLGTPNDVLFFKAKLSSLSPTSVEVDASKSGSVYAQHHEEGYHGEPEGPNAWIGSAKVSAVLAP
jgi:hypothetical protein